MPQATYQLDPAHTGVHFSVRHLMLSNVRGDFTKVSGTVVADTENPANSSIEASIETAHSIHTCDPQRDGHLKSADFLDTAKFPAIDLPQHQDRDSFGRRQGDRGPDDPRGYPARHPRSRRPNRGGQGPLGHAAHCSFSDGATINRKNFRPGRTNCFEKGGVVVGDDVKITIDVEAIRK